MATAEGARHALFPNAVGLAPGAEGTDVEALQNYLSRFGYLPREDAGAFALLRDAVPGPTVETGKFTKATADALKSYQRFHKLPETGVLDEATVAQMSLPRCGFPDVVDAAGLSTFSAQGNRWSTTNLRYGFENFTPDVSQNEARTAFATAASLWSAVTPLNFSEVPVSQNPEIRIRFVAGDHGDGSPFDGAGAVLAHGFYPPPNGGDLAGDIHFDEAETWGVTIPVPAGRFDLVTVACHELGHALGLAHSSVAGALMWPAYSGPQRFLAQDDVNGIRTIYGSRTGSWESLGGVISSAPDVCSWAPGRLDVFARGQDNALWHKWYDNGWSGWESLGGTITSNPTAVSWSGGRIDAFARGTDNALWHKWYDGAWKP
jgi:hypothetical protein